MLSRIRILSKSAPSPLLPVVSSIPCLLCPALPSSPWLSLPSDSLPSPAFPSLPPLPFAPRLCPSLPSPPLYTPLLPSHPVRSPRPSTPSLCSRPLPSPPLAPSLPPIPLLTFCAERTCWRSTWDYAGPKVLPRRALCAEGISYVSGLGRRPSAPSGPAPKSRHAQRVCERWERPSLDQRFAPTAHHTYPESSVEDKRGGEGSERRQWRDWTSAEEVTGGDGRRGDDRRGGEGRRGVER